MNSFTQLLAVLFVASGIIISGCKHSDSSAETNPDFNRETVFKDYGTYGRTVYFEDTDGKTWCYYDLLTFGNPEEIKLTFSAPVQNTCAITTELPLISYTVEISGEQKTGEGTYRISTVMTGDNSTNYFYSPEGDLTQGEPRNDPLAPVISLFPIEKNISPSLFIRSTPEGLISSVLSMADYYIPAPAELLESCSCEPNDATLITRVYAELLYSFGLFGHLETEQPYPETTNFLFPLDVSDRHEPYLDHPYQKLSPSEDDPYPLNQIRVE